VLPLRHGSARMDASQLPAPLAYDAPPHAASRLRPRGGRGCGLDGPPPNARRANDGAPPCGRSGALADGWRSRDGVARRWSATRRGQLGRRRDQAPGGFRPHARTAADHHDGSAHRAPPGRSYRRLRGPQASLSGGALPATQDGTRPAPSRRVSPRWRRAGSRRQLASRLLGHHVRGVPVRPVLVALTGPGFMLAMGSVRAPERAREVTRRRPRRRRGVDPSGQSRRDFLQLQLLPSGSLSATKDAYVRPFGSGRAAGECRSPSSTGQTGRSSAALLWARRPHYPNGPSPQSTGCSGARGTAGGERHQDGAGASGNFPTARAHSSTSAHPRPGSGSPDHPETRCAKRWRACVVDARGCKAPAPEQRLTGLLTERRQANGVALKV